MTRILTVLVAVFLWALPWSVHDNGVAHAQQQCASVDALIEAISGFERFGEPVAYTPEQAQRWLAGFNDLPPSSSLTSERIIFFKVTLPRTIYNTWPLPPGSVIAWLISGVCVTNTIAVTPPRAQALDALARDEPKPRGANGHQDEAGVLKYRKGFHS